MEGGFSWHSFRLAHMIGRSPCDLVQSSASFEVTQRQQRCRNDNTLQSVDVPVPHGTLSSRKLGRAVRHRAYSYWWS
jgi:hypothetical protein